MHIVEDEVVISGVGGYFPRSINIEEFKKNLFNDEKLTDARWPYGERGVANTIGMISNEHFDSGYFGIHRQQCTFMDPTQRLILERAFEALVDAGVNPSEVRGRRIGCYMGSSIGENDNVFLESVISGFGVTGHSRAMMPNRVSYWLNLKGPSISYDSNWISGIEVLKSAYNAIKSGQCEAALVGTANLALNSEFQWLYTDMGLLSSDGSTKAFDANAEGYARSDGVVVLYIQRASDARRFYASILNVATSFNGNREGSLIESDAKGMEDFLDDFYSNSSVKPNDVEFVETHGAALKNTDRKELEALSKIYCKNRKTPLLVGSVKPHTGHSEASAAFFSIVKVLIAMETQTIPATIQMGTIDPEIKHLLNDQLEIVRENRTWNGTFAAVNAIGIDSYYGHILLKSNAKKKVLFKDSIPRLVFASTRTEAGMKSILNTISSKPNTDYEYIKLIHDLFSKPILGHLHRGYAILSEDGVKHEIGYHAGNKRQIWFVYSGMGSQWAGMVSDLMKLEVFSNSINKCHEILMEKDVDLKHIISTTDKTIFHNILHSFVGIAAIQIALTDLLSALDIVPDGIIGHSVGELGCAYADGCLTREQMILAAYYRGKASIESPLIKGMMAAIGVGYNEIKDKCPDSIDVACHNGPDSCTISGPADEMEVFVKKLQEQGTFARLVNVSNIAYHSRYITPAGPRLLNYLKEVIPHSKERSQKWISTSNMEENWNTHLAKFSSPEYHTNNLLSSVLFEEGLRHIPKDSVLIEIAPHGLLQAILKRSLKNGCSNVALTNRGSTSSLHFLLQAVGKLYLEGINMNAAQIFPKIDYPVSKATPSLAELVHWEHSELWRTGLEDKMKSVFGVEEVQVTINSEDFRDCIGHQIDDEIILPFTSHLQIVCGAVESLISGHCHIVFENLSFKKPLIVPRQGVLSLTVMVQMGSGDFEITLGNEVIVSGGITFPEDNENVLTNLCEVGINTESLRLYENDIYKEFLHRGHKYSGKYRLLRKMSFSVNGSEALISGTNKWADILEVMLQQYILHDGERSQTSFIPKSIQKIIISKPNLPNEGDDAILSHYYNTNTLATSGIQMMGLQVISPPKLNTLISFDAIEFLPLKGYTFSTIENAINVVLQITLSNFGDLLVRNIMVYEMQTDNSSLNENIKNVFKCYPKLNPTIKTVLKGDTIANQDAYPTCIISNDYMHQELVDVIRTSKAFLLVRCDKRIVSHKDIIEVCQFWVNGVPFSIVRKNKTVKPVIITVKDEKLTLTESVQSASWMTKLNTAISKHSSSQSIYLVSFIDPVEGIYNFCQDLLLRSKMSSVRLLFLLDKEPFEISDDDHFFSTIFKQDMHLLVYRNGVFGVYLPIPLKMKDNIECNSDTNVSILKEINPEYVGLNLSDENEANKGHECNLGLIDYCGISNTAMRVMGIANFETDIGKLKVDSILSWNVPERWCFEDAVTMPYAYICAYYILIIKGKLLRGETVLIHVGCSPIGIALIAVASMLFANIYVTVCTDKQRAFLKKYFINLKDHNIMNYSNTNFEPQLLKLTSGLGAHVIVNCLSGELLQASCRCLADYGRFLQIGKITLDNSTSFGMNIFLRNTSFSVIDLMDILNISDDTKKTIKDLIQKGIEEAHIRPIPQKTFESQNIDCAIRFLRDETNIGKIIVKNVNSMNFSKLNVNNPYQFNCDASKAYLIYGGALESWIDMTEWLAHRGAKNVVVCVDQESMESQNNYAKRRLSLIETYFNTHVKMVKNQIHTKDDVDGLLNDIFSVTSLHAIFLLSHHDDIASIKFTQYVDTILRTASPSTLLISFTSASAGITQKRVNLGYLTYNIISHRDLIFKDTLMGLDEILSYNAPNIIIKNDRISDSNQESIHALYKKISQILPPSLEAFIDDYKWAPKMPELIQLPTIGPRYARELPPIFIIPGLFGYKEVVDFAYKLIYPTYCVVLPRMHFSMHELAEQLVQIIKQTHSKGPYNIVGVSWGGALAIEIGRILCQEGASLHLFFADSAPFTMQAALEQLGDNNVSLEVNILSRFLQISDINVQDMISKANTWKERIRIVLKVSTNLDDQNHDTCEEALTILMQRIVELRNFTPIDDLVLGSTHLIRPFGCSKYDNCGLLSYCKQTPQISLVSGDHRTIVSNPATAEYVNANHYVI